MSAAAELMLQKWSYALCWMLVHSLWQTALVLVLASGLAALLRRDAALTRYRILLLAFMAIPALGGMTFYYYYARYDATLFWLQQGFPLPEAVAQSKGLSAWVSHYSEQIVLLWVMGFSVSMLRFTGAYFYCRKLLSDARSQHSSDLNSRVTALVSRMDIVKPVAVKVTKYIQVPCVIGHFKPVILLPAALLTNIDMRQLEAILLHELAHVQRNDYIVGLVQGLIKTLYFFNPFVHILLERIATERENICDDIAVKHLGDAMLYARTLESIGQTTTQGGLAMAITGRNSAILARIKRQFEKTAIQQTSLSGLVAALALFITAMLFAVNAIGSDMPKVDYQGIESLSDEQVAELIVLARDAIKEKRENNEGIRETILDDNPQFLKLTAEERIVFVDYLEDELWRFFNLDGWNLKLEGASQSDLEETRKAMYDEHIGSRIQHLTLTGAETIFCYQENGNTLFEFSRLAQEGAFYASLKKEFVKKLLGMPEGQIAYNKFLASYRRGAGITVTIPWDKTVEFSMEKFTGIDFPLRKGEAYGPDHHGLKNSYLVVNKSHEGFQVILSEALLTRLAEGKVARLGNGYVGVFATLDSFEIPLHIQKQHSISKVMVKNYSKFRTESDVDNESWVGLNNRIENLSVQDRQLLPSENDIQDILTGMAISSGVEMNPIAVEAFKYNYLSGFVSRLEKDDAAARRTLQHRPLYSKGDNNRFVAMRNFLPHESGVLGFDIDVRDKSFAAIFTVIESYCPDISGDWSFINNDEVATFVFKNLDCERVVEVLNYIEGVKTSKPRKFIYQ